MNFESDAVLKSVQ